LTTIGARTAAISFGGFVAAAIVLHTAVLLPERQRAELLRENLSRITETYIQLKATDLSGVVTALQSEVKYLTAKHERIFASAKSREEIPGFISRLEERAKAAGLQIKSTTPNTVPAKQNSIGSAVVSMQVAGRFQEMIVFLKTLRNSDEMVLLDDFRIRRLSLETDALLAQFRFVTILEKE